MGARAAFVLGVILLVSGEKASAANEADIATAGSCAGLYHILTMDLELQADAEINAASNFAVMKEITTTAIQGARHKSGKATYSMAIWMAQQSPAMRNMGNVGSDEGRNGLRQHYTFCEGWLISLRKSLEACVQGLGVELPVRTYPETNELYDACLSQVSSSAVAEAQSLWRDGRDEKVIAAFGRWAEVGYPYFQLGTTEGRPPSSDNPFLRPEGENPFISR